MLTNGNEDRMILRPSLHDQLVVQLRQMIVETELTPGQRIDEKKLCEQFAISRTPLREALKVMASEGLVELLPNRSPRVSPLTPEMVGDLFRFISWLDRQAGELAVEKVTDKHLRDLHKIHKQMQRLYEKSDRVDYYRLNRALHTGLVEIAGNAVFTATYSTLMAQSQRARFIAIQSQDHWDRGIREHEEILALLAKRDGPALGQLLMAHVSETGRRVQAAIEDRQALAS